MPTSKPIMSTLNPSSGLGKVVRQRRFKGRGKDIACGLRKMGTGQTTNWITAIHIRLVSSLISGSNLA
jgi:hypothetical protein